MVIEATQLLGAAGDKGDDIDVASNLGYIAVGIIVGMVAGFLVLGRDPMGVIGTILLGIVGAVVGGWVAGELLPERPAWTGSPRSWSPSCWCCSGGL
jgi:uncharacterized membrane protein YeaQ/YmgE (transglycosylase-associated protein family)